MGKLEMHPTEKVYKPCEIIASDVNNFKSTVAQFYVTCVECFLLVLTGMMTMMPTIIVGALHNKDDGGLSLDDTSASWIGSILYICHPCGALTSGYLAERFGRRGAMIVCNIPYVVCWTLFYYAASVQSLVVTSMLMGFGVGLVEAPVAAYLSEVCEPRLRGVSNSMIVAACTMGNSLELYLGSVLHWRTSALICVSLPVVSFLLCLTVPESPVWLITKGRLEDAHKSLAWLRGFVQPHDVQREFDELVRYSKASAWLSRDKLNGNLEEKLPLDNHKNIQEVGVTSQLKSGNWLRERCKEWSSPKLYLPFRMILITFFLTQCAGLVPFKSFIVEILDEFWFPFESKWAVVMTGAMSFLGAVGAIVLVKMAGKRILCIVCMIICTLCIFALGLYASYFKHTENLPLSWLLVNVLALVNFAGNVGVINIPWILNYEVYPVRGRSMACGLSAASGCFMSFLLTKTYLQTQHVIGLNGMFYMYGVISFVGCIYFIMYMPETEGKSLEQIETYFTPHHDQKEKYRLPKRISSKA